MTVLHSHDLLHRRWSTAARIAQQTAKIVVAGCAIPSFFALHFAVLQPLIHRGNSVGRFVDPDQPCSCDCWDLRMKDGHTFRRDHYRSFIFNVESHTYLLACLFGFAVVLVERWIDILWEAVRLNGVCRIVHSQAIAPFVLLFVGMFPEMYGWWVMLNYINERWYPMMPEQTWLTASELVCLVLLAVDFRRRLPVVSDTSKMSYSKWEDKNSLVAPSGFANDTLKDLESLQGTDDRRPVSVIVALYKHLFSEPLMGVLLISLHHLCVGGWWEFVPYLKALVIDDGSREERFFIQGVRNLALVTPDVLYTLYALYRCAPLLLFPGPASRLATFAVFMFTLMALNWVSPIQFIQ